MSSTSSFEGVSNSDNETRSARMFALEESVNQSQNVEIEYLTFDDFIPLGKIYLNFILVIAPK
jgi:hypothetical protein